MPTAVLDAVAVRAAGCQPFVSRLATPGRVSMNAGSGRAFDTGWNGVSSRIGQSRVVAKNDGPVTARPSSGSSMGRPSRVNSLCKRCISFIQGSTTGPRSG